MSWLTIRIDEGLVPVGAQRSMTSARSPSAVSASTWLNGSSMKRISGLTERARAIPRRCFMPPDNSRGYASSKPFKPTNVMAASDRCFTSAGGSFAARNGSCTFCVTVIHGYNAKLWKTMPTPGVRPSVFVP